MLTSTRSCSITIDLKTFPLVQIEKEGLYGLIDIEKHSIIVEPKLISPIHISRGKYKRYKTSVGKDIITDGYICYSAWAGGLAKRPFCLSLGQQMLSQLAVID